MKNDSPIGFFDSGYGGLTVLKEVQQRMPEYDYLYLGDNDRAPYGTKSLEEVYQFTWECVKALFHKGCELVILACNTASAKALRRIQQNDLINYPGKRVLGVIRPSAEVVGDFTFNNEIVVLGTQGTIASNTYLDEFSFFSPHIKVNQYVCHNWVRLIESGEYETPEGKTIIEKDLNQIITEFPKADVVLLGCTHYPIVQDFITNSLPEKIQVVSQGKILAESLKSYLYRHPWMDQKLSKKGISKYLTSGSPEEFKKQAAKILKMDIEVEHIQIEDGTD